VKRLKESKMAYNAIKNGVEINKENTIKNAAHCKANEKGINENKSAIEELKRNSVPFVAFESAMARYDQVNFRLVIALIITLFFLVLSNVAWLFAWNTWDNDATKVINTDGVSNFINGDGVIDNE
jgi:hypothetical protein